MKIKCKINWWFFLFQVGILFSIISCNTEYYRPPYVISKPTCSLVSTYSVYEIVGVYFDFLNTSSKTVYSIEVSFVVFDSKTGKNPFCENNLILAKVEKIIKPDTMTSFEISLDSIVTEFPEEPYLIEYFTITKIEYSDGSVYENQLPLGPLLYTYGDF